MTAQFDFTLKTQRFDEDYTPAESTRLTTNFANLARGESRRQNLRTALQMIDNRFNSLAHWDNPHGDRYSITLDIVSVDLSVNGVAAHFPAIEILQTTITDHRTGAEIPGIVGNNFSSYVRDYDFSILLREHNAGRTGFSVPDDFGDLHGRIFRAFVASAPYRAQFARLPVICLSVSDAKTYTRTTNAHPILGSEYTPGETSLTETYFRKMGMEVRYFLPQGSTAPYAFSFFGDLLNDYRNLELISTIATMETFQKIYRPEIYNANSVAGQVFRPRLNHQDFSQTRVTYDREERTHLAIRQGELARDTFIIPLRAALTEWPAHDAAE